MTSNSTQPQVCICIPTYNAEKTIKETLLSLLNQSYQRMVIKVVDNHSVDRTLEIVRSIADKRLELVESDSNIGAEGNFNRCIQLSHGHYTAIYHADDVYEPDMVQVQVNFLESHPEVGALLTEATLIDEYSRPIGKLQLPASIRKQTNIYDFPSLFKAVLEHSNFLICPSAMVRTEIYKNSIVEWRGNLFKSSADLDVWLRIARFHSIAVLAKPLMRYRISNSQWTAKVRRNTGRADFFRVIDFYLQQDLVKKIVTKQDLTNYTVLERRDRIMRAVNFFLQDRIPEAKSLCYDVFSPSSLQAALKSKRGKLTLVLGSMVRFFLFFHIERIGKRIIQGLVLKLNK